VPSSRRTSRELVESSNRAYTAADRSLTIALHTYIHTYIHTDRQTDRQTEVRYTLATVNTTDRQIDSVSCVCGGVPYLLHCTLSLATQCIVIGPVCGFVAVCVCVCVCVWGGVCYHDNSKLRASILTKLSL